MCRFLNALALDLHGEAVSRHNFSLPTLGLCLEALSAELHNGKGFFVLRGLDSLAYSPEDTAILFLGIASYIGERKGKQTDNSNMFCKWAYIWGRPRPPGPV
jgi:hypothetical protein